MSVVSLLLVQNNNFFSPMQVQRGFKSSKDMNKTHKDKEIENQTNTFLKNIKFIACEIAESCDQE
jgi:hypothetical protein